MLTYLALAAGVLAGWWLGHAHAHAPRREQEDDTVLLRVTQNVGKTEALAATLGWVPPEATR